MTSIAMYYFFTSSFMFYYTIASWFVMQVLTIFLPIDIIEIKQLMKYQSKNK